MYGQEATENKIPIEWDTANNCRTSTVKKDATGMKQESDLIRTVKFREA